MTAFPIAENYEKLTPIVERLYHHTDHIAQIAILPLFLLSVLMAYSEDLGIQGAVVSRLKRLIITMVLLVAFPSLTGFIKNIGQEIAMSIDNLEGIDQFLKAASDKASSYSTGVKSLLDFGNDLIVSLMVSVSFVILYLARYILIAFYHFYWMILLVTGPFMILGHLFEGTSNLTKNLFKSLMLVAAWPIVWSILSAFLKALPFQDAYSIEGGYTAIVIMNLIIAIGLLFSPFMLSQFCEGTIVGMGSGIVSTGARAATAFVGPKAAAIATTLGSKAYPVVSKYVPSRKTIYSAASKLASKSKLSVLALFLIPFVASASSTAINVRPGLSSVVCFAKSPDSIAIGDGRYFQAQKIGNNLLLRSTVQDKETNLLIFAGGSLATSYKLQSNLILPHSESVDCDKKPEPPKSARPVAALKILSTATKNGLRAELLRKAWESSKRDYFTIRVRLVNQSATTWQPDWSKVTLKQGAKLFAHSGLSSERRDIPPGSRVSFDVQYTRPEIARNRGFLEIPSKEGTLELLVEKGGK
jgi:hypothetical protein